jgi:hypothetical protein
MLEPDSSEKGDWRNSRKRVEQASGWDIRVPPRGRWSLEPWASVADRTPATQRLAL